MLLLTGHYEDINMEHDLETFFNNIHMTYVFDIKVYIKVIDNIQRLYEILHNEIL